MSLLQPLLLKQAALRGFALVRGVVVGLSVLVLGVLIYRFPLFSGGGPPGNVVVVLWGATCLLGFSTFILSIAPPEEKAIRGWSLTVLLGGIASYAAFLFTGPAGGLAAEERVLIGDAYAAAGGVFAWAILWLFERVMARRSGHRGGWAA